MGKSALHSTVPTLYRVNRAVFPGMINIASLFSAPILECMCRCTRVVKREIYYKYVKLLFFFHWLLNHFLQKVGYTNV